MAVTLNIIYMEKQQSSEGVWAEMCVRLMAEPKKQELPLTFMMTTRGFCPRYIFFESFVSSR